PRFRDVLEARRETANGSNSWWQLHWPRDETIWQRPKILSLQMGRRPAFVPALGPSYVSFSVNVFVPDDANRESLFYLAGLLNSRLLWTWYRHHAKRRGAGLEINGNVLRQTPIRRLNPESAEDKRSKGKIVAGVGRMIVLNRDYRSAKTGALRTAIGRKIENSDRRIDRLVNGLYGLTEADILIVRGTSK
ncbi:MAG: hypothetical protein IID45_04320, partial [Planctomycetes bacterium]|nr:hypothetical protein [Planctomycetota bacterium]